jgi:hypothetical protein
MSSYFYSSFINTPCLPYIDHTLKENPIAGGEIPRMLWEDEDRVLKVTFNTDLNITDKAVLDGIVNDSDGLVQVVKNRHLIMSEIFWAADKTVPDQNGKVQIIRLMDAVDTLSSFLVCLDNYNYVYALMRMQIPLALGSITQDDYDLVAACIPSAEFI